jgi:nitronate monooxygenase
MSSRREFIKNSAMVGMALSASSARTTGGAQGPPVKLPTPRAMELMSRFGLKYPIFQAPHSGAGPDLVAAVSGAGAMGILRGTRLTPEDGRKVVTTVRARTERTFAVNYILAFEPDSLPAVLDAGAPILHFSWGLPKKDMISAIRSAGAKFGVQVANAAGARLSLDLGADYLVCQGVEAGGHVQSSTALYELLPKVLEKAGNTPVLVAGGIGHGKKIREALLAGASGAMLGTRFVATQESLAHPEYKSLLIKSTGSETTMSVCFQDGWPGATHRALRNSTLERWEAAGCPPVGRRPGEGDVVARRSDGTTVLRYNAASPLNDLRGMITDMALFAGLGVSDIRDIPSASELVSRLWTECLEPSR